MVFGYNIDPRDVIYKNILAGVAAYKEEKTLTTDFGQPILGFARSDNPLFDIFFDRGELEHPKSIFRPGRTVIVHFLPFEHPLKSQKPSDPEAKIIWEQGMKESVMLSLRINGIIRETLSRTGYTVSGTNTPGDWNPDKLAPEWNHKLAAFICGMGELTFGASLLTESGSAGRFGASITDYEMEPSKNWEDPEIEEIEKYRDFYTSKAFRLETLTDKHKSRLMDICPVSAITPEKLDREKCHEYCKSLEMAAPSQEACGRCWPISE